MIVEFLKLTMENFMSYREKTTVPLCRRGVVRIEGRNLDDDGAVSNMAGKSIIIEALLWCLFGKTLRGVKHGEIVNRKSRRNCSVSTSFEIKGQSFRVARYHSHKKFQNRIRIFRGDREIYFRHADDAQSKLESILGCGFAAFVNSTVFGGFDGARRQFALLPDSEQKRVLDSFLKFERFELALDRTRRLLSESREQRHESELQLATAEGKVNTFREKIKTLLTSTKEIADREKKERVKIRKRLKTLKLPDATKYDKRIERAEKLNERFLSRLNKARVYAETKERSINQLRKKIRNWKLLRGKTLCPTCGQKIGANTKDIILKHLRRDLGMLKTELADSLGTVAKYKRRRKYGSEVLKDLFNKRQSATKQLMRKTLERAALRKRLSSHEDVLLSPLLEEARYEYSRALAKILVLKQRKAELDRKIKALEFWETGFGNKGVKTLVMREILPSMNGKLREYASQVFQSPVELEFKPSKTTKRGTERELFHLHYKSKLNSTSYLGESSGGRRRIDICVLLVFSWLASAANVLLVDELLDGLDDAGRQSVLNILSRQRGTVLVISHERELKSQIGTVWTVTKKNGVSRLEIPNEN